MGAKKTYQITQTTSTTFLDNANRVVNGFTVWVTLIQWDETHPLQVKSLEPKVVDEAVRLLISKRAGLDNLGD